jgi:hypothetical protein
MTAFNELIGKTLTSVKVEEDRIYFNCSDGSEYLMYHQQDCCEGVDIDDINGDLDDLIGDPILQAEERSNSDSGAKDKWDESYTWTFYTLATVKANVTIRWYGTSNGYYSESVDFEKITSEKLVDNV